MPALDEMERVAGVAGVEDDLTPAEAVPAGLGQHCLAFVVTQTVEE